MGLQVISSRLLEASFLPKSIYETMNQIEKWLLTAAKVAVFTPPAFLLFFVGIITRLWWVTFKQTIAVGTTEIILAVVLYAPPLTGLIILLISLVLWLKKGVKRLSSELLYSLVYSVLAIMSPVWLFVLWLFMTGFNR